MTTLQPPVAYILFLIVPVRFVLSLYRASEICDTLLSDRVKVVPYVVATIATPSKTLLSNRVEVFEFGPS